MWWSISTEIRQHGDRSPRLARIDAGATDLNIEDVSLVDLTQRVAARYGEPDVPIVAVSGLPSEVAVDKVRFERILGNLLENARNHGGGPVRIELTAAAPGRFRLAVEDGGPGVAQGERERIFERFARGSGRATASVRASASRWSPSTPRRWVARPGCRIAPAEAPASSSSCPST